MTNTIKIKEDLILELSESVNKLIFSLENKLNVEEEYKYKLEKSEDKFNEEKLN